MAGTIATDRHHPGIALVTIAHPDKKNALTEAMWRQLAETFQNLAEDSDLRAVVITGSNGDFAAGGDLSEFPTVRANRARALQYHGWNASFCRPSRLPLLASWPKSPRRGRRFPKRWQLPIGWLLPILPQAAPTKRGSTD